MDNLIEQIGGPFALGQWFAAKDESYFAPLWREWCIKFADPAELENQYITIEAKDGNIVFAYTGQQPVAPLRITREDREGKDLLEQIYALLLEAQGSFQSSAIAIPLETDEGRIFVPKNDVGVTLPEPIGPSATVISEPTDPATTLPLPSTTQTEAVTLPEPVGPSATVISEPTTPVRTLPLLGTVQPETIALLEPVGPAMTVIPKPATPATTLPLPATAQLESVALPKSVGPSVTVTPEPTAPVTTLPRAGRAAVLAAVGQYLLPVEPFLTVESDGRTLADLDWGPIPRVASNVLNNLKVRRSFAVLSDQFKGFVLDLDLDKPIRAIVRLSIAKENSWIFGGEVFITRSAAPDRTTQLPLIFTLNLTTNSLVMNLNEEINLFDDLLRPIFGNKDPIPDGLNLAVVSSALALVREGGDNGTAVMKALVAVNLAMAVDFGELPVVGEEIKAQGDAEMTLGIQYAPVPLEAAEMADIRSALGGDALLAAPADGSDFDGMQLLAVLRMADEPLLVSISLNKDTAGKLTQATPASDTSSATPVQSSTGDETSLVPASDNSLWRTLNRSFGPVYCKRVGIRYQNGTIWCVLDAFMSLGGVTLSLQGLAAGLNLKDGTSDFTLDGIGIDHSEGPIGISGTLLKTVDADEEVQYSGAALISTDAFTLSAIGAYAPADKSLFIFALLDRDLGGPTFFYVTGLALGFGSNRRLNLPSIENVHRFPLIQMAMGTSTPQPQRASTGWALAELQNYIVPASGEYWFAVGVRFTSFRMIESFVLLSVSFGHEVQIALLGMSRLVVPNDARPGEAIVYAELAIRAVIKPEEGKFAVEGRLTDVSYIFSKDCRLTGGFAFYAWFAGSHAGDFVVTLGGYHPEFVRPDHYPLVPRLGVNWQISDQLAVTAELYYALTPSCLMAGGKLSMLYQTSSIKAWFVAYADFLLSWKPFYYMVDIGVEIGVEAKVRIRLGFCKITISIRVSLGAQLQLWGPEFAGKIRVDLSVISFTIAFGPAKSPPPPLTAQEFVNSFLPAPQEVVGTQITGGLIRQEDKDGRLLRVVNVHSLVLTSRSVIPITAFAGLTPTSGEGILPPTEELGIRSMGKVSLKSTFTVTINGVTSDRSNLRVSPIKTCVPDALWGKSNVEGVVPSPLPEANTFEAQSGIRISFAPIHPQGALPPMAIEKFAHETFNKPIPWNPKLRPAQALSLDEKGRKIDTVMDEATIRSRQAVLAVLAIDSPFVLNSVNLEGLVAAGGSYFQDDPEICRVGEPAERYYP